MNLKNIISCIGKLMIAVSFLIGSLALTFGGWLGLSGAEGTKAKIMLGFLIAQAGIGFGLMKKNGKTVYAVRQKH